MSERTFFTLRYALPGYTFLLIFISINLSTFYSLTLAEDQSAMFGAFLAFLYLLSGSAIGFLVSQVWYVLFNHFFFPYGVLPQLFKRLQSGFNLKSDKHQQEIFCDYLERLSGNKKMFAYAVRRWDLLHLLGSTLIAIPTGVFAGVLHYSINVGLQGSVICDNLEVILLCGFLLFGMAVCLYWGLKRVSRESATAIYVAVMEVLEGDEKKELPGKLKKIFPKHFFIEEPTEANE